MLSAMKILSTMPSKGNVSGDMAAQAYFQSGASVPEGGPGFGDD